MDDVLLNAQLISRIEWNLKNCQDNVKMLSTRVDLGDDPESLVDERWLRQQGGVTDIAFKFTSEIYFKFGLNRKDCGLQLCLNLHEQRADWQDAANRIASIPFPKTRGQFRALYALLSTADDKCAPDPD